MPGPFRRVLDWIGDRLPTFDVDWLDALLPGGRAVVWIVLGAILVVAAAVDRAAVPHAPRARPPRPSSGSRPPPATRTRARSTAAPTRPRPPATSRPRCACASAPACCGSTRAARSSSAPRSRPTRSAASSASDGLRRAGRRLRRHRLRRPRGRARRRRRRARALAARRGARMRLPRDPRVRSALGLVAGAWSRWRSCSRSSTGCRRRPKGPRSSSYATSPRRRGGVRGGAAALRASGAAAADADRRAGAAPRRDAVRARARRDGARGGARDRRTGCAPAASSWSAGSAAWVEPMLDDPPRWEPERCRGAGAPLAPVAGVREVDLARRRRLGRARRRAPAARAGRRRRCS